MRKALHALLLQKFHDPVTVSHSKNSDDGLAPVTWCNWNFRALWGIQHGFHRWFCVCRLRAKKVHPHVGSSRVCFRFTGIEFTLLQDVFGQDLIFKWNPRLISGKFQSCRARGGKITSHQTKIQDCKKSIDKEGKTWKSRLNFFRPSPSK